MFDVIVVGGGPAGMTAALYALRNGKSALVIEKTGFGGQITHSPKVENIPGFLSLTGNEFADKLFDQIMNQGAEIEIETVCQVLNATAGADGAEVPDGLAAGDPYKIVLTEEGSRFIGRTVILATGVKHRMLGLPGEEDLVGEGISFCAVCDGDFYAGRTVCVAGGGNSALQEAILLTEKCKEVIMLQDLPFFTGEAKLQEVLFRRPNVKSYAGVKVDALLTADGELTGVRIAGREPQDLKAPAGGSPARPETLLPGETRDIACDGLFVAIGLIPENEPFKELADLNSFGYFDSDEGCLTKTPGLFIAGDCRSKAVRQVTTAAADGATAALAACRYINGL
ncbi:MAG: FAD-dependent oxidoreductase [Clostridia bacterium]|nr:FAD-dependent oxidoreductase [Clostridia bacterium]